MANNFYDWVNSLQWDAEQGAYRAPDGSLWEREEGDDDTYAEVRPACSEEKELEAQSKLEAGW